MEKSLITVGPILDQVLSINGPAHETLVLIAHAQMPEC